MNIVDPNTLKKYDHNPKEQTIKEHERMLESYKRVGQLVPFLVLPDGMILGGNHGLDIVRELGLQAKVVPVDFVQEGDEWYFVNEGEVQRHISYKSLAEGMLAVSIEHNQKFSHYDPDLLSGLDIQIDLAPFTFDFTPQLTIQEKINIEEHATVDNEETLASGGIKKDIKCPSCGHEFQV